MKKKNETTATPPPNPIPRTLLAGMESFQDGLFRQNLRRSAIAHLFLAAFGIVASLTLFHQPLKYLPSLRVDLVDLPDIKKSDLNKYTPDDYEDLNAKLNEASRGAKKILKNVKSEFDKPKPPLDDAMAFKKKKASEPRVKSLKSSIDRIKALTEIESELNKRGQSPKVLAKGNQLSKGASLTGDPGNDANAYIGKIQTRLRENWNLPVWLSKQSLDAKAVVFLDRQGYVRQTMIAKSSGNKQFDEYVLKTIRMSQPFGPPPDEIVDEGLTLGFPL